ncbi:urea carboxylase, partial [Streptomyces scabiei]|nr:urea carboxylase [Streptomyces scabiei]
SWRGTRRCSGRRGAPLWEATPEGRRAFLNTAEFLATRGIA